MNLVSCHNLYQESLKSIHTRDEIRHIFKSLISGFFDWEQTILALDPHRILSSFETKRMKKALDDLQKERPLQYILGYAYFRELRIEVNEATLIPRPETEELVGWVLSNNKKQYQSVLDIGTGSGCIALALKNAQPSWRLTALDISENALVIAQHNSQQLGLKIECLHSDINKVEFKQEFDCIVSNPPYVTQAEKTQMKTNVLDYEPHTALFVSDSDPLLYYRAVLECAQKVLTPSGQIYFEINPQFSYALIDLAVNYGFPNTEIKTDTFGKKRMLRAQR